MKDFLQQLGGGVIKPPITSTSKTPLIDVMRIATDNHVHRVWVTDEDCNLAGVISLTDMLEVCRKAGDGAKIGA